MKLDEIIAKKIQGRIYPIEKFRSERFYLYEKTMELLKSKNIPIPPISKNNINCLEDMALEKYLAGKHIWDMSKEEQILLPGDTYFLTDKAFNYYIFELILLLLSEKSFYAKDAFIQQLFINESKQDRFFLFSKEEVHIIIYFFQNILDEINEVLGNRKLYSKLEEWEQIEVYHPFMNWEKEITKSILIWKKHHSLFMVKPSTNSSKKIKLQKSFAIITKQYKKSKVEVYISKHEENIKDFFSNNIELQEKGLKGIKQLLNIRLWDEVFALSTMNPNYPDYYKDIFVDKFNNFDEWYIFIKEVVLDSENYQATYQIFHPNN